MKMQSELLEKAVKAFSSLPGIGKKTALRLVLHLYDRPEEDTEDFAGALVDMRKKLQSCEKCGNLSDHSMCGICSDRSRDERIVCVVESVRDVMAIEETGQYKGLYHVLGGVISPIDGVGPADLSIDSLKSRIEEDRVAELIMAISPTIEGETTIYYISRQFEQRDLKISTISRGVAFGGDLEYADEITLGRSIAARIPYSAGKEEN